MPRLVALSGERASRFSPIESSDLAYATNTNETVIKVGSQYFLLQDGVWFVADSPDGPWQLARMVPDEIYQIPPSSPVYNATYVRVYETEPDPGIEIVGIGADELLEQLARPAHIARARRHLRADSLGGAALRRSREQTFAVGLRGVELVEPQLRFGQSGERAESVGPGFILVGGARQHLLERFLGFLE